MSELSKYVRNFIEAKGWTYEEAESHTGVSRSTWNRVALSDESPLPLRLTTVFDLAKVLDLPRWKVLEMAGYNLELEPTDHDLAVAIAQELERKPWIAPVWNILLTAKMSDQRMFLAYLRSLYQADES